MKNIEKTILTYYNGKLYEKINYNDDDVISLVLRNNILTTGLYDKRLFL